MNKPKDGCAFTMTWLVTVVVSITAGLLAWSWLEPNSAFEYFCFFIGWVLLSLSGYLFARVVVIVIHMIT